MSSTTKKQKKQAVETQEEKSPENKVKLAEEVNIEEFVQRLKDFENKVLLERIKTLEKSFDLLYKETMQHKALLSEIKQAVAYISLGQEEMLNALTAPTNTYQDEDDQDDEPEDETRITTFVAITTSGSDTNGKKWN